MRKMILPAVALLASILVLAPVAGAAKGDNQARKLAKQECKAEKKADKAAFKATYGKRAMRTCVKGEKSEQAAELRNAAKECKAERGEDADAFRETYGTGKQGRNAHGKCVSSKVKAAMKEDVQTFKNAAKECRAERGEDADAFRETYGTRKGKNAFGKCVSSKVKQADSEE